MFDDGRLTALSLDALDDLEEEIIDALDKLKTIPFENPEDYFFACAVLIQMRRKVQLQQTERLTIARAALPWRPEGEPIAS